MLRLEVKIICWIYSHQRAVLTSSLSQSSPTSMPACWTRFKSTLYNEDGSNTSTFLTNDSLSFLGRKNMKFWKTWSTVIVQIVFTDAISYNANLLKVEKSLHEEEFNPERIFFLHSNMAAVTSCHNGLSRFGLFIRSGHEQRGLLVLPWWIKTLCWVLLLNILVQYASYSNYYREGLFGT